MKNYAFRDLDDNMQEKLTAQSNELQRLRSQLEQTQRELGNARMHRDEAQGELARERLAHDETKALSKKQQGYVDTHRKERDIARENLNAITREARRLEVERDNARRGKFEAEKAAGDLLEVLDSVVAEREGVPAVFDVRRRYDHPGAIQLDVRRVRLPVARHNVRLEFIPQINLHNHFASGCGVRS